MKRALPDRIVFTYQGDGDIAAIGTAETIHAAAGARILAPSSSTMASME